MMAREDRDRAERFPALRILERTLFVAGLVCLAVYASACAHRSFFQSVTGRGFDRELERALANETHDQHEWSAQRIAAYEHSRDAEVEALARLEIPSAGVSVMVLDGTDDETLERAVGRIEGTAGPDEPGNLGIAGHRDSFFRGLRHVRKGDALSLATHDGLARYEVADVQIVQPQDVQVLEPTDEPAITLVTCYPFYFVGSAPKRYVVRAYRVDFTPWSREALERYTARPTELARRN